MYNLVLLQYDCPKKIANRKLMFDRGTNCGKEGPTMVAVYGPGDHWWHPVWSRWTTYSADHLWRDGTCMCVCVCLFVFCLHVFLVLGNLPVTLWMYKDQMSSSRVPTLEYQQALCEVPSNDVFNIKENELWIGSKQIGNQLLYTVPQPEP